MFHRPLAVFVLFGCIAAGAIGCSNEVKVGAVVSESGPASVYGDPVRKGLELAAAQINEKGGFRGKPLRLLYRDDRTRTEEGARVARELIEVEHVHFIIGAVSSPVTLEIAPICNDKRVVLISPSASADAITAAGAFVYRVYPSDILEGTSMAQFAKDLGIEKMVLFVYDTDWGAGLRDVFTDEYQGKYRQVVNVYEFMPDDTSSFETWAAEVKEIAPEAIYIAAYAEDWGKLIVALREAGVDAAILGTSAFTPKVVQIAGDAAESLVFPQPSFSPDSDYAPAQEFAESFEAEYGHPPDRYAAYGYDSLMVLYEAMLENESTHVDNVRIGLANLDNYPGATGLITFDSHGDVVQYPRNFVIRDGKPVAWETFIEEGGALEIPRAEE
jgi:branched-chain amino acid transport system substrate-binding protein